MRLTEAAGSTNAVQVRLPVVRNVQVDNQVDFVCIDPSGSLEEEPEEEQEEEPEEEGDS